MVGHSRSIRCEVCKKRFHQTDLYPIEIIREPVLQSLLETDTEINSHGFICNDDYQKLKNQYLESLFIEEKGELSEAEKEVLESIQSHDLLVENTNESFEEVTTLGQRLADKISAFGGSWKFIGIFTVFLLIWMISNSFILLREAVDPYPYILLNLILSCLAAMQGPIIMMSQNRRAERDRIQAENDYKINLKAELQIRHLNQKLDRFMNSQWYKLLEIQKAQVDFIRDLSDQMDKSPRSEAQKREK